MSKSTILPTIFSMESYDLNYKTLEIINTKWWSDKSSCLQTVMLKIEFHYIVNVIYLCYYYVIIALAKTQILRHTYLTCKKMKEKLMKKSDK